MFPTSLSKMFATNCRQNLHRRLKYGILVLCIIAMPLYLLRSYNSYRQNPRLIDLLPNDRSQQVRELGEYTSSSTSLPSVTVPEGNRRNYSNALKRFFSAQSWPLNIEQPADNVLIDLTDFKYIIVNDVCSDVKPVLDILLVVVSAPNHFENRQIIRRMHGNHMVLKHRNMILRRIFLLGYEGGNQLNERLEMENNIHNDLLQGNFVDSYRNLTYKYIMSLKYISKYCHNAKVVVKQDDDMLSDMFLFEQVLRQVPPDKLNNTYHCEVFWHGSMPVLRTSGSKWDVKREEYAEDWYQTYCSGVALFFTPSVAIKLNAVSSKFKYFWIDDAHVGTLANAANINFINYDKMIMHGPGNDVYREWVDNSTDQWPSGAYFGQHHDHSLWLQFWNKTLRVHNLQRYKYLHVTQRDIDSSLTAIGLL